MVRVKLLLNTVETVVGGGGAAVLLDDVAEREPPRISQPSR